MSGVTFTITIAENIQRVLGRVDAAVNEVGASVRNATRGFDSLVGKAVSFQAISNGLSELRSGFKELTSPMLDYNSSLTELSAITGLSGEALKQNGENARKLAVLYGTDASVGVESFKVFLSKLSPELAKSSDAMKLMGNNAFVLSKSMGDDTAGAASLLSTAMNQFAVDISDPIKAASTMTSMMNVMAASAKAGSAELPQIGQALEQVGGIAKTVGVSFEETNAAIQVLDKAGKTGAEGGVALRNVLMTLGRGEFLPKASLEGLKAAGINVAALGNKSLSLKDRLELLKPVMKDTAFMSQLFGAENLLAGQALLENTELLGDYTTAVQGTNAAQEYADTIMGSFAEKLKRQAAWVTDLKIGLGEAIAPMIPFVDGSLSMVENMGKFAFSITSIAEVVKGDFVKSMLAGINAMRLSGAEAIAQRARTVLFTAENSGLVASLRATSVASVMSAISLKGIGVALMSIPVVGWIAAGITAAAIAIKIAWDNSKQFRATLYGVWEAAKAVFNNISIVVGRLWTYAVKPLLTMVWNSWKLTFTGIKLVAETVVGAIISLFNGIYNVVSTVFNGIYNFVSTVFNTIWSVVSAVGSYIGNFFSSLWGWFANLFGGFASAINDWLVQPIKNAFGGVWDFIVNVLDGIKNKLLGVIQPVIDLWNKIFGSDEGMVSVSGAYDTGYKKGEDAFDKSKNGDSGSSPIADAQSPSFDVTKMTAGKLAANKAGVGAGGLGNSLAGSKDSVGGGSGTTRTLNINKLVENMNFYLTSDKKVDATSLKEQVNEVLISLLSDANANT